MRLRSLLNSLAVSLVVMFAVAGPVRAAQLQPAVLPAVPNSALGNLSLGREGLFLGGGFLSVGPFTGPGVQLDAVTGAPIGSRQGFDGVVRAVVADGSGGWYVGGDFRHAGGRPEVGLVHLLANGTRDARFEARLLPRADGAFGVDALALAGTRLYVAGRFSSLGGGSQSVLAAIDATTGMLVGGFRPTFESGGTVGAVVATPDRVYAGGSFTDAGRRNLVALASGTGAVITSFDPAQGATPRPDDTNGSVEALALSGNRLLVGGAFSTVGSRARNHLAALDATTGAVDAAFDPNADADVDALLVAGPRLFVGGNFNFLNGRPRHRLAAIDLNTGVADPAFTADADGQVLALAQAGGRLIVAGRFRSLAGIARAELGAVDAATGTIDPGFDPAPGRTVRALAAQAAGLYAGGEFVTAGAAPRAGLALLDARTGRVKGLRPSIRVRGPFALLPGHILVADGRPEAAGVLRLRELDRRTGGLIGSFQPPDLRKNARWEPAGTGFCVTMGGTVRCYDGRGRARVAARTTGRAGYADSLAVGSTLYLSGSFTRVDGQHRSSLGAIDLHTGRLRNAFRPRLHSYYVSALAAGRDRIYVVTHGLLLALNARSGRTVRHYPRAGKIRCNSSCGAALAGGRIWTFDGSVLRVLSTHTGALLARVDVGQDIESIAVAGSRAFLGGSFGDPDVGPQNASHPFLAAFDLRG